jgi:hypothetical protein
MFRTQDLAPRILVASAMLAIVVSHNINKA